MSRARPLLFLAAGVVTLLVLLALLPGAFAAGLGRLIADLWVTTISTVFGLLGGVFGG